MKHLPKPQKFEPSAFGFVSSHATNSAMLTPLKLLIRGYSVITKHNFGRFYTPFSP
jgi:hypothetical protein